VGKVTNFLDRIDSFTGRNRRHNRALRDVTEFSAAIQEFLARYDLPEESSRFDTLLKNVGLAKFDLTAIAYKGRILDKTAKRIKGTKISPLIKGIISDLENMRRALITPDLGSAVLGKVIPKLGQSLSELQDAISGIEYK
jgi:hypothetical protein